MIANNPTTPASEFRKQFAVHHANGLKEHTERNLAHIKRVLDSIPVVALGLEIGCFKGGMTNWLLANGVRHLDVIDTFEGSPEHRGIIDSVKLRGEFFLNTEANENRITIYQGKSADVLHHRLGGQIYDFIYVDGSHDSQDVIIDATLGFRLLKKGGAMVFDDYEWNYYDEPYRNPKPAIDFFLNAYADQIRIIEKGYQVSIQKL